jgi:23S rRNA (pseudouridine1915-N3)-methyltransferase
LKIVLISYGKPGEAFFESSVQQYIKRIRSFYKVEWMVLKASSQRRASDALNDERLVFHRTKNIPARYFVLGEEGRTMSSVQFAAFCKQELTNYKDVGLLIGGAWGIHEEIKNGAAGVLSLSPMTFTHEAALFLVAEQVYRVSCILQNHPYHHE